MLLASQLVAAALALALPAERRIARRRAGSCAPAGDGRSGLDPHDARDAADLAPRGRDRLLAGGGWPWSARVGRNGLSASRHEGDGTTPLGTFAFGTTMYGVASDPGVRFRYHRLVCGDWWNEDVSSATYNTFQHVRCGARRRSRRRARACGSSRRRTCISR
jgi:hypothetical protein